MFQFVRFRFLFYCCALGMLMAITAFFNNMKLIKNPSPDELQTLLEASASRKQLIITYIRGGSSFLGELIATQASTLYIFEPLQFMEAERPNATGEEILQFLDDLFECKYHLWNNYLQWIQREQYLQILPRASDYFKTCIHVRGWEAFKIHSDELPPNHPCFDPQYISEYCLKSSTRLIKVNRLRLRAADDLLKKHDDLKVIHSVRDPRGTMNSRRQPGVQIWCKNRLNCKSASYLCDTISDDLSSSCPMDAKYPKRVATVRFEDLACRPKQVTDALFRFLGYSSTPRVTLDFLTNHTVSKLMAPRHLSPYYEYHTYRASDKIAFSWRKQIANEDLVMTEKACEDVIKRLGWEMFNGNVTSCADVRNTVDGLWGDVIMKCSKHSDFKDSFDS